MRSPLAYSNQVASCTLGSCVCRDRSAIRYESTVLGFFGINYFDQSCISWFVLLAMISTVTAPPLLEIQAVAEPAASPSLNSSRWTWSQRLAGSARITDSPDNYSTNLFKSHPR